MRPYATPVLAFASVLALTFPAFAQQPHPRNPPALPRTSHSSRPVAPGSAALPPSGETSPSASVNISTWTPIGPASLTSGGGLVSGRVTGIAVDPTNSSNIYLAAAGGGVWNTTDGGTTWTPLTDTQVTLAMGSIAIAPTNHLKIYAGTGEANNSEDSNHGEGILVSGDGGSTWTLETASGAFAGVVIGQIAVDPTNENTAYAAVGGTPQNGTFNGNNGIWKTTDGGNTWTNVTAASPNNLDSSSAWSAVVIDPNTPTTLYAALGDFADGGGDNAIYRSTNSGASWSMLANGPNSAAMPTMGRIALAVSPAAKAAGKHVLYVAVAANPYTTSGGLLYFGRSDTADAATPSFTNLTSDTPDFLGGENGSGQGWYDIAVNVDTNGIVYCSGVEDYGASGAHAIITSSNLGVTWTDISTVNSVEPHTDNHAIAFDSSNRMLAGNDGGIYRYDPSVPSWTDLNSNLNTIQFTGIGLHPTDIGTVVGGSQDNGTELYSDNPLWVERVGGDGGYARISQTNPMHCYHEYAGSPSIERSDDGCMTFTVEIYQGIVPYNYNFYPPYILDPTNGDHILFGSDAVNESSDAGDSWVAIGNPGTNNFNPSQSAVDTIAFSPAHAPNPAVIYASTGGTFALTSQIFVTSNDGTAWTERDLPACSTNYNAALGCRVNEIVTDPNDLTGQTAFAVTSNFTGGGRHVYRTTNEGASWTDISANLPDMPTWSVQVDTDTGHTAYISNETGVYSSPSPYSAWTLYGTGLPHVQGVDLELNSSLHVLGLATHGRGAWEILTPAPPQMTSPAPGSTLNASSETFRWTSASPRTSYVLKVSTLHFGGSDVFAGNTSATSLLVPTIPTNGAHLYVQLEYKVNGAWVPINYNYTEKDSPTPPAITTPAPGSTLTSSSTTFTWSPASIPTSYILKVSTSHYGGSDVFVGSTNSTSIPVSGIPANGAALYVELEWKLNGAWTPINYSYTESGKPTPPAMTTPAPGSTLPGSTVTFTWNAGAGPTEYQLRVGTTGAGSSNIYLGNPTTSLSATVSGIPTNGQPVNVALGYKVNGAWHAIGYTYQAQ